MAGGATLPFIWLPVLAMGSPAVIEEPAGNICLDAADMRNISVNGSFNNNIGLGASTDPNDNITGDWSTC